MPASSSFQIAGKRFASESTSLNKAGRFPWKALPAVAHTQAWLDAGICRRYSIWCRGPRSSAGSDRRTIRTLELANSWCKLVRSPVLRRQTSSQFYSSKIDATEVNNIVESKPLRDIIRIVFVGVCVAAQSYVALNAQSMPEACSRPSEGSVITEPEDLRSQNGVLKVELTIENSKQRDGSIRYCYLDQNGKMSPNLRVNPGDLVILKLKNDLQKFDVDAGKSTPQHRHGAPEKQADACASGQMSNTSTNLHFHGLMIPPLCHQDDVLKTSIQPGDPPFEYQFRIPKRPAARNVLVPSTYSRLYQSRSARRSFGRAHGRGNRVKRPVEFGSFQPSPLLPR
jgi:hypothetical protein